MFGPLERAANDPAGPGRRVLVRPFCKAFSLIVAGEMGAVQDPEKAEPTSMDRSPSPLVADHARRLRKDVIDFWS
jgi:hypothetical protein